MSKQKKSEITFTLLTFMIIISIAAFLTSLIHFDTEIQSNNGTIGSALYGNDDSYNG